MRGRKPKPNVLKMLHRSREPLNPDEPQPRAAAAEPPAGLDAGARRVWTECVPELAALGLFTVIDVARMARTCTLEALGRRLLAKVNPARKDARSTLLMARACFELTDRVWAGFGVAAPGERARLKAPPREEDKLAAFKAKHHRA